eukprot:TRINITY_DN828_c1_g1_i1.p1 TRINITY_DN828_c1_g1~~TRINITY_DN828_c1_g1_i1.p1  ORF type:complete len:157 (-),score=15.26 TRINITY_DN828_c1_g1_i1:48-518(-)
MGLPHRPVGPLSIRSTLTSDAPVEPRSTPSRSLKVKKKKKKKEKKKEDKTPKAPKVVSLFQRGDPVIYEGERCMVMKVQKTIPPMYTVRSERTRQRHTTDACQLTSWKPTLDGVSRERSNSISASTTSYKAYKSDRSARSYSPPSQNRNPSALPNP